MLNTLRVRWNQFLEETKEKSFGEALKKSISRFIVLDRIVVPVYHHLAKLKPTVKTDATSSLEFLVVDESNVDALASMHMTTSRRLKGTTNTRLGYYSYAVASNGEIIGDIWCATPRKVQTDPIHPDLSFLGIKCGENEAYMFDMYVPPDSRGKVITNYLLGGALNALKEDGFDKVYGFYEKDNLPALWTHRLFGYTELEKRKYCRLLFFTKTKPVTSNE